MPKVEHGKASVLIARICGGGGGIVFVGLGWMSAASGLQSAQRGRRGLHTRRVVLGVNCNFLLQGKKSMCVAPGP